MRYCVHYQIATYSGTIEVNADEDDDKDRIVAIAEAKLARISGPLPAWGARSYRVEAVLEDRLPVPRGRSRMENAEERAGRERAEEDRFDYLHDEGKWRR